MSKVVETHIMYGLPGSGKTHWCVSNIQKGERYVDVDEYYNTHKTSCEGKEFAEWMEDCLCKAIPRYDSPKALYIDGLFTTTEAVKTICNIVKAIIQDNKDDVKFIVHYFIGRREDCLYNDEGRRKQSSKETIMHLNIKEPNIVEIARGLNRDVGRQSHCIVRKPVHKQFFAKMGVNTDDRFMYNKPCVFGEYLYSQHWCLGGEMCTYTGDSSYVSADSPIKFRELYDLLLSIDNDIPFRVVQKIEELVTVKKCNVDDYYGGSVEYAQFAIKWKDLYNAIYEYQHETEEEE